MKQSTSEVNKQRSGMTSGNDSKMRCWNCQLTGHSRCDCPSPRRDETKCATCHWFGGKHHKSCTSKKTEQLNTGGSTICTFIGPTALPCPVDYLVKGHSGSPLHEKLVVINGTREMNGLIDSGSSVCTMKESTG